MLFVDAGANKVIIGDTANQGGSTAFQIYQNSTSTTDVRGITIRNASNTTSSQSGMLFVNYDNIGAKIASLRTGSTYGDLRFQINTGGTTAESSLQDAVRILGSAGGSQAANIFNEGGTDMDFRVESDNSSYALFVDAGNDQVMIKASGMTAGGNGINSALVINAPSGPYNGITLGTGYQRATIAEEGYDLILTANAYPAFTGSKDAVIMKAGNSGGGGPDENLRVDQDGIKFNGDTAAANALNDYEEGTFNVELWAGGTQLALSEYGGSYVKIGKLVTINFEADCSNTNGASGPLEVRGMPFTIADVLSPTGIEANGSVSYWQNWATAINSPSVYAEGGTTTLYVMGSTSSTVASNANLTAANIGTGEFRGTVTYRST
jgi:hypothetical protein